MIHVCFGLHDKTGRYSKFTGTAMRSVFANTNAEVTIHILHDKNLTADNRDKFSYVAGQYNQTVKFYNVEELCADKIAEFLNLLPEVKNSPFTVGTFYRLAVPQVLPSDVEKVIYLDSDIAVNLDINELWQIEPGDKPLGAVAEEIADSFSHKGNAATNPLTVNGFVRCEDYFNAGVLLMNLELLRRAEENLRRGVKFIAEISQRGYFDQDVLNYVFSKTYLKLPAKFNFFVREERRLSEMPSRKIYHYAGNEIKMETVDPFNRLWIEHFIKTPWFDVQTFGRLCESVKQLRNVLKGALLNLSSAMSGKTRVFFILQEYLDFVVENFSVQDDEEIIIISYDSPMEKLIGIMNDSRGKKVFFIMAPDFSFDVLIQAGFVANGDFFDGFEFLSDAQGLPLDSYPLIWAL